MRTEWVAKRRGQGNVSQMHYARQGVITEEMHYVATRERLPVELIRDEGGKRQNDYSCQHQSHKLRTDVYWYRQ